MGIQDYSLVVMDLSSDYPGVVAADDLLKMESPSKIVEIST